MAVRENLIAYLRPWKPAPGTIAPRKPLIYRRILSIAQVGWPMRSTQKHPQHRYFKINFLSCSLTVTERIGKARLIATDANQMHDPQDVLNFQIGF